MTHLDPIIVPVTKLFGEAVGPLTELTVTAVDDGYEWTGIHEGRHLSGKLVPNFQVGANGTTIVLGWDVALDEQPSS